MPAADSTRRAPCARRPGTRRAGLRCALLAAGACLLAPAGSAHAAEVVKITRAGFSPAVPGLPTNAFGSATISSTEGPVPSPITHVNVYGPAGVTLDLEGSETCDAEELRRVGVKACPVNSKAGEGGGEGIYQVGKEIVKEPYTLEFFLGDNRPGHVELLVLLTGYHPVALELVFTGRVVRGPKPYGLGFSLDVPLIHVLPEASDASATSAFLRLGAKGHTYIKRVHGKKRHVPIRGIILPKRCPRGGWPIASQFTFQDGSVVTAKRTIKCRRGAKR